MAPAERARTHYRWRGLLEDVLVDDEVLVARRVRLVGSDGRRRRRRVTGDGGHDGVDEVGGGLTET